MTDQGQHLSADFDYYKLTTAADVPEIETSYAPTACPHTPIGSQGIGKGRPGSVPWVLTNAVCDARVTFDIEIASLPLRCGHIRKLIEVSKFQQSKGEDYG